MSDRSPFERTARAHIASRGSAGTRELYKSDLDRWLAHCETLGVDPADPLEDAAADFRDALLERKAPDSEQALAPTTVRRTLSALSKMYKVAIARRTATWNPFDVDALARPPSDEVALTKEYTREEAVALLAAAEEEDGDIGLRDVAVMTLLYDTGLRVTPVVTLRREQIYELPGGQRVLVQTVKKKGRVEVELPPTSVLVLDRWLSVAPESKWVFPAARGFGPLTRRAMNQRLAHYGDLAGVKDAAPHRFRATYITEALDAGVPLSEVQAAVHHSDPKSTQRYDRGARGRGVAAAVAKFRESKK